MLVESERLISPTSDHKPQVPGNEEAHRLSRKATEPGSPIQSTSASNVQLLASVLGTAKSVGLKQGPEKFYKSKVGRFTKSFDKALPGPHTRLLYNRRAKLHANVLCQLRSGINRLNKYLAKINGWKPRSASAAKEKSLLITFCLDVQDGAILEAKFAA